MVWRVIWDSVWIRPQPKNDTLIRIFREDVQINPIRGTINISLEKGDWVIEGWVPPVNDSAIKVWEKDYAGYMWAETGKYKGLNACLPLDYTVCAGQVSIEPNHKADVTLMVHIP